MTNTAVAKAERLYDNTVKDLDTIYMQQQVAHAGLPAPRAIGVDEIAIRKGHDYRIVVSDLDRRRPIWVGGKGHTEADMDRFFAVLGANKTARIQRAPRWTGGSPSTPRSHSMRHRHASSSISSTSCAISATRLMRSAVVKYRRLDAKDRAFIKGHRYTLLSRREHLSLDGRRSLAKLLKANKWLNTAYLLKESFGQFWCYQTESGARAFFERWKQSLKWQRLTSYEKFAAMIDRDWDGIA